jgi:hypothetical protein
MLSDEDRVAAKGGLFAVVRGQGGGEAPGDKSACVLEDCGPPLCRQVSAFLRAEHEPTAKGRVLKRREELVQVAHPS